MDVKRVILIAALALVTYLLVMQWNNDYGPKHQQQVAAENAANANSANTDLPDADTSVPAAAADVPADLSSAPSAASADGNSKQLITVKTDVLELKIDPHGGDIVESELLKHESNLDSNKPFVLMEDDSTRTYIAQSGLVGPNGTDSAKGRPQFKSASTHYELGDKDTINVDLVYQQSPEVTITKRFALHKGDYRLKVEYIIDNQSAQPWQGALFGQLKRDGSEDPSQQTSMSMKSYMGAVFSTADDNYEKVKFGDLDDQSFAKRSDRGWAAIVQHYFVSAWVPKSGETYKFTARKNGDNYIVGFTSPTETVAAGTTKTIDATLYTGPKDQDQLQATAPNLKLTVDYGILWWIAYPLYLLMKLIHTLVGNWGLSIIGVTICVKLALFQLNAKAFKSMAKMRKFAPLMAKLKEQYGDDRQRLSQEMMKLYQKEKINPLGGCLPIVIQMPVFISLYWVLKESIELRHAPFFGYIQDLSQMDPYFILPILMGISMFVQQHLNPAPPDPTQAKIMKMLPIIFTFFFLWFPAGLVLYWVSNNILSIAQQWIINRQIEAADTKETPAS